MKNVLSILAVLFILISCNKENSVVITGNKSSASIGEEVVLSVNATSSKKFKVFVVEALLYTDSRIINTGHYYRNDDKTKEINDQFTFLIPNQVVNENIVPGDYYEFRVYAETGNDEIIKAWKVEITP